MPNCFLVMSTKYMVQSIECPIASSVSVSSNKQRFTIRWAEKLQKKKFIKDSKKIDQ